MQRLTTFWAPVTGSFQEFHGTKLAQSGTKKADRNLGFVHVVKRSFHTLNRIKDACEQALSHQSEKELIDLGLKTLRGFSKRIEKRLLVIVENFQTILDDQIGSGAKDLLKRLSDADLLLERGSSAGYVIWRRRECGDAAFDQLGPSG